MQDYTMPLCACLLHRLLYKTSAREIFLNKREVLCEGVGNVRKTRAEGGGGGGEGKEKIKRLKSA